MFAKDIKIYLKLEKMENNKKDSKKIKIISLGTKTKKKSLSKSN